VDLPHGKLCRLSAAFAISNMGHAVPAHISEPPFQDDRYASPRSSVCNFAGHLMETDEHEEIFTEEAESWYEDLKNRPNEEVLRVHGPHCPWIQQIIDA
jgi:hypothetical protein